MSILYQLNDNRPPSSARLKTLSPSRCRPDDMPTIWSNFTIQVHSSLAGFERSLTPPSIFPHISPPVSCSLQFLCHLRRFDHLPDRGTAPNSWAPPSPFWASLHLSPPRLSPAGAGIRRHFPMASGTVSIPGIFFLHRCCLPRLPMVYARGKLPGPPSVVGSCERRTPRNRGGLF